MANADDLKRLADEIASAYEERVKRISQIKRETADSLRAFGKARNEMAKTLRSDLARFKSDLDAAEGARKKTDQAEVKQRSIDIENLLSDFDAAHQDMADNLQAELVKFKSDLDAAESDRKAADQAEIKERKDYIIKLLTEFDNVHSEMADRLRAELVKFKSDLDAAESDRKAADQAEIRERKDSIVKLLTEFDNVHSEMADRLRAELARFKSDLDAAEAERKKADQAELRERKDYITNLMDEFDKAHAEMAVELKAGLAGFRADLSSNVSDLMADLKRDHSETAKAWRELLASMQSARKRAVIRPAKVEAAVKVKPVEEAIEEEEVEEVEREELKEEIIELLEENPDGLKMTQIADNLGIESWRSLIPVMRELLDEGEVRKEDSVYYVA